MKNVIFLVIDCLGREYIERFPIVRTKDKIINFFDYLDQNSVCFTNMYSTAPFTMGALAGMWYSKSPIDIFWGNDIAQSSNKTIFDEFKNLGYDVYVTDQTSVRPYLIGDYHDKNTIVEANRIILPRVEHYCTKKNIDNTDICAIKNNIEVLFTIMGDFVKDEYAEYKHNSCRYIDELIKNRGKFKTDLYLNNTVKSSIRKVCDLNNDDELLLSAKIREKNRNLYSKYNRVPYDEIKRYGDSINRCLWSGENALWMMKKDKAVLPNHSVNRGIRDSGIFDFIDNHNKKLKRPYFAYFHEFSFHFPESIMRYHCNEDQYMDEVRWLISILDEVEINYMSVIKALSIIYINNWLKELFEFLDKNGVFENTYLVITADHGITNYMYPSNREYRWMFYKDTFHVPLWIVGKEVSKRQNHSLCSAIEIPRIIIDIIDDRKAFSIESYGTDSLTTEWMNGIPDYKTEYIKFGYRSRTMSLTYCVRLNQLFDSARLMVLFDIVNDPNETINLVGTNNYNREEYLKAKSIIEKRFKELQKKYLPAEVSRYLSHIDSIKIEYIDSNTLDCDDIVVLGTDSITELFLRNSGSKNQIRYIYDFSGKRYFYGHIVQRQIPKGHNKYVIACYNEVDMVEKLFEAGISKVSVFTGKKRYE